MLEKSILSRSVSVNNLSCEEMRKNPKSSSSTVIKNTLPYPPSHLSRWWQLRCCCFYFFSPPGSSALRFHRASPPTSLCYSSLPPPSLAAFSYAGATCVAAVRWSGAAAGDCARGRHDGGRQAEEVVKLLHHGQDYSSCSTGACYLRNCWCSLHRSGSYVFPSSRPLQWLTGAC